MITMDGYEFTRLIIGLLILAPIVVAIAYAVVRAASFAHFRTKLEYLRTMMKEVGGDQQNGKD